MQVVVELEVADGVGKYELHDHLCRVIHEFDRSSVEWLNGVISDINVLPIKAKVKVEGKE